MITINRICDFLRKFAPLQLAEDWDNVGLLIGDPAKQIDKVMTCLTITPESCAEAISGDAGLIITHHPLPFRGLKKLTTETTAGKMILDLIAAGIAVYSPHTAFDSAENGINQQTAIGLELQNIKPLVASSDSENQPGDSQQGSGRRGELPEKIEAVEFCKKVKRFFHLDQLRVAGSLTNPITKVAIACGSAGQFIDQAERSGCDAFVTGEASFHTCLEAEAKNILLLLPGHYATERFALEMLAEKVQQQFNVLHVWASKNEADPIKAV